LSLERIATAENSLGHLATPTCSKNDQYGRPVHNGRSQQDFTKPKLVTFGAMWRRSVIAIWRFELDTGAGSKR